jgi:virginiamycin B lyase
MRSKLLHIAKFLPLAIPSALCASVSLWLIFLFPPSFAPAPPSAQSTPNLKSLQRPLSALQLAATFQLDGKPDWLAISDNDVWVSNGPLKSVHRITASRNAIAAKIEFTAEPCSGLVFAFDTLWIPLCADQPALARVRPSNNKIVTTLPFGPADDEGGITASEDSIWLASGKGGTLLRIDPATNSIRQRISVPPGSANPLYAEGLIWITGNQTDVLTPVDARTGEILPAIPVGPQPRFLTTGAGSIWTLNQGDGTITRVDIRTRRVTSTIAAGIPGHGGEITFGAGYVWATLIDVPLTQISPVTNTVVHQWTGSGGDAVRFGHDSLWLTHLHGGRLWRISPPSANPVR